VCAPAGGSWFWASGDRVVNIGGSFNTGPRKSSFPIWSLWKPQQEARGEATAQVEEEQEMDEEERGGGAAEPYY
jgi:hypothetical protein